MRSDVQGLRALAVLMVVAFHAGLPLSGGFTGVDVFFVISGYVITGMLSREWKLFGSVRLRKFYARRFLRLAPALSAMVTFTVLCSAFILSPLGPREATEQTAVASMLMSANVVIARLTGGYFGADAESNALLNTWSLSVEEQFYLLFPTLLISAWVLSRKMRKPAIVPMIVIGFVTAGSLLAALYDLGRMFGPAIEFIFGFYGPAGRVWEFSLGALLYLCLRGRASDSLKSNGFAEALGAAGVATLLFSGICISGEMRFPGPWTILPVASALLLIMAGSIGRNRVSSLLEHRTLVHIGDRSYSIYLWHWPFIVFAEALWPENVIAPILAAALSFVPAFASFRWIEQPLRYKQHLNRRRLVGAAMSIALGPVLFVGGLHVWGGPGSTTRDFRDQVLALHLGTTSSCHGILEPGWRWEAHRCTWPFTGSDTRSIYLLGDSNADHFSEAVLGAGKSLGRPVVLASLGGCPFLTTASTGDPSLDPQTEECRAFVSQISSVLKGANPATVILSMSDKHWLMDAFKNPLAKPPLASDLTALRAALASTVNELKSMGHEVLLVQSVPKWNLDHPWTPAECSDSDVSAGECAQTMTTAQALVRQESVRNIVSDVAQSTSSGVVDTFPALCPADECSTYDYVGRYVRYSDESHITVLQSQLLVPLFTGALRS